MHIKQIIFWILGLFLLIVIGAVLWYFIFVPKTVPQTSGQPTATLPVSGSVTSNPSSSASPEPIQTMSLATQSGSSVVAQDFIHNGATIPDTSNAGRYLLAGSLGYCPSNATQCQAAPAADFNVYYNSAPQSFTIALTQEPIGQARLHMEQFLLPTLGLTQVQLCTLNYYVGVTTYVNPQYAGENLGFSFCPGATVLPK